MDEWPEIRIYQTENGSICLWGKVCDENFVRRKCSHFLALQTHYTTTSIIIIYLLHILIHYLREALGNKTLLWSRVVKGKCG